MEVKSVQKFVLTSPKKLRPIVLLIRDLSPKEAFDKLPFVGKKASQPLRKVIGTAIANAKDRGIDVNELIFKEIQIGEGPRLKRYRAGARGRAKPYKRRMSHISVVLMTRPEVRIRKGVESVKGIKKKNTSKKVSSGVKSIAGKFVKKSKKGEQS